MYEIDITVDDKGLADLMTSLEMVSQRFLPHTTGAIKRAAYMIQKVWKSVAMGAPLKTIKIKNASGTYARSIRLKMFTPYRYIIWADTNIAPHAEALEYGTPQVDLKQVIPYGDRGRVARSKGGGFHPYSIVPFRWGTPGSNNPNVLPEKLYQAMLDAVKSGEFRVSQVSKKTYKSPNFWGEEVRRRKYQWGDRVKTKWAMGDPSENPKLANLDGMVMFDQPSGTNEKRRGRTGYMTFRTVSSAPPMGDPTKSKALRGWERSWVVPARQGMHIAETIAQTSREIVRQHVKAALKKDLGVK